MNIEKSKNKKVLKMSIKEQAKIVLQINQRGDAHAWIAWSNEEIILGAVEGFEMEYEEFGLQDIEGLDPDDELVGLLNKHNEPMILIGTQANCEYVPKSQAPSELDHAKAVIEEDLQSCEFLTVEEAMDYMGSGEAESAVEEALEWVPDLVEKLKAEK